MSINKTLNDVQVDDVLLMHTPMTKKLVKVTKVTKTMIVTDSTRFNKTTGHQCGENVWGCTYVTIPTENDINSVRLDRKRYALRNALQNAISNSSTMDEETIDKILLILNKITMNNKKEYTAYCPTMDKAEFLTWLNSIFIQTYVLVKSTRFDEAIYIKLKDGIAYKMSLVEVSDYKKNGTFIPPMSLTIEESTKLLEEDMGNKGLKVLEAYSSSEFQKIADNNIPYNPTSKFANGWVMEKEDDEPLDWSTEIPDEILNSFDSLEEKLNYLYNYVKDNKHSSTSEPYLVVSSLLSPTIVSQYDYDHFGNELDIDDKIPMFAFESYEDASYFEERSYHLLTRYYEEWRNNNT